MRKFVSIAGLICIAFILVGCSVRTDTIPDSGMVTREFKDASGELASVSAGIPDKNLPLMFMAIFEKTSGSLSYEVADSQGNKVFEGKVVANVSIDPNLPKIPAEPEKWGTFTFNKTASNPGTYKISIIGQNASGKIQVAPSIGSGLYFSKYTGTVLRITKDVTDTNKELGISLLYSPVKGEEGMVIGKIIDPQGKEIKNSRMESSDPTKPATLDFYEKPAKTGTYTAVIEAKNASGSAIGMFFSETQIPWVVYIKPILFIILGLALYFMIKPTDRKIMIWGGMFWIGTHLIYSVLLGFLVQKAEVAMSPTIYFAIIFGAINIGILGLMRILMLYFTRFFVEVKKCSPKELVAFAFGFVFVEPLLASLSYLTNLSNINGQLALNPTYNLPGVYPSDGIAFLDIASSFVNFVAYSLGTIALVIIFMWVLRQREKIAKTTLWLAGTGAVVGKIVLDFLFWSSGNPINLLINSNLGIGAKAVFGIGSPLTEALILTTLMVAVGVIVIINWKKLMGLALKACPVTIDDLTSKEA